jgi:hypothetical protein
MQEVDIVSLAVSLARTPERRAHFGAEARAGPIVEGTDRARRLAGRRVVEIKREEGRGSADESR